MPAALAASLGAALDRVQGSVADLPPELRQRLTLERDLPAEKRGGVPATEVGDAIFILGDPVAFDPLFWEVLNLPLVVQTVREALGVQDVAAHFLNATVKHPRFGRAIGWHRDFPNRYACPAGSSFLRVMLCLDGMTEASGATAFLPGSHYLSDGEARVAPRPSPPDGAAVLACCAPGDAVLIHPKVLHGGGRNVSATARRNLVLQAGDAAAPLLQLPEQEAVAGHRLGRPRKPC